MEAWNAVEARMLEQMEELSFPGSVKTTVIWALRKAENRAEAESEIEALLEQKATPKELVKAVQPMLR